MKKMEEDSRKDELIKYVNAKIAQAPVFVNNRTTINGNPLPFRKTALNLQRYAESFIKEEKGAEENRIIILPGLRGVGKTTMLLQLYEFLVKKQNINIERVLYFSTDELKEFIGVSISEMINVFFEEILKTTPVFLKEKIFILIDEAHFDKHWDRISKILYDQSKNIFLVITGSSALSIEISPDLARRSVKEKVFPLSFSEYLLLKYWLPIDEEISILIKSLIFDLDMVNSGNWVNNLPRIPVIDNSPNLNPIKGIIYNKITHDLVINELSKKEIEITVKSSKIGKDINHELLSFISLSDLPFSLEMDEKAVYDRIISMIDRVIERDIFSIHSFKSESKETIKRIIYFLASQSPGGTSHARLAKHMETSSKQIRNILDVLEKTHLIFSIKPYGGAGKIAKKSWKYYFLSSSTNVAIRFKLGLYSNSKEKLGVLAENIVAAYLFRIRETINIPLGIFYDAREGGVDFLIHDSKGRIIPIEVGIGKKDKSQVYSAIKEYNSPYGIIIDGSQKVRREENIIYIPLTIFSFA